jgi:hypothetical protein
MRADIFMNFLRARSYHARWRRYLPSAGLLNNRLGTETNGHSETGEWVRHFLDCIADLGYLLAKCYWGQG